MKVLDGELEETQYEWPAQCGRTECHRTLADAAACPKVASKRCPMQVRTVNRHARDQVAYIHGMFLYEALSLCHR